MPAQEQSTAASIPRIDPRPLGEDTKDFARHSCSFYRTEGRHHAQGLGDFLFNVSLERAGDRRVARGSSGISRTLFRPSEGSMSPRLSVPRTRPFRSSRLGRRRVG